MTLTVEDRTAATPAPFRRTFALLTPVIARRLGLLAGDSLQDHHTDPATLLRLSFARIEDHDDAPDCLADVAPAVCELHGHPRAVAAQVTPDEHGEIGDLTYWVSSADQREGLPVPRSMLALDAERDEVLASRAVVANKVASKRSAEDAKRAVQGLPPVERRGPGRPKKPSGPTGSGAPMPAIPASMGGAA
jgi:hypothetical protein